MKDIIPSQGVPEYDFADETQWSDERLKNAGHELSLFLKQHEMAQTAPKEALLDTEYVLGHIVFELYMRKAEKKNSSVEAA